MVKLDRIYTRGGDDGASSLVGGARVSKAGPRLEAIGAVDEANAALGLARLEAGEDLAALIGRLQNDLFDLGADLATPLEPPPAHEALRMTPAQTTRLEREIDALNAALPPLTSFVLPGGNRAGASLHLARTAARRAERAVVALGAAEPVNPAARTYINRLSDLLFVAARAASGADEVLWRPGATRG